MKLLANPNHFLKIFLNHFIKNTQIFLVIVSLDSPYETCRGYNSSHLFYGAYCRTMSYSMRGCLCLITWASVILVPADRKAQ